jgi:hypothetical protein
VEWQLEYWHRSKCSDVFELKFSELSQAELGHFNFGAEPSWGISIFELKLS